MKSWVSTAYSTDVVGAVEGEVPGVSRKRRVDNVLYVDNGERRRYIVVEFDREQHSRYKISREVRLLQEWYADRLQELRREGVTVDVIRWNPDRYTHADGQTGGATIEARLEKLQEVLTELIEGKEMHNGVLKLHYLFYSYDRLRMYQRTAGKHADELVLFDDNGERMCMEESATVPDDDDEYE